MSTFLVVIHVIACVFLVLAVLVQAGKDGGLGLMNSGSSQTVFGSSGGANFFTKFTAGVATVFMVTSIALTVTKSSRKKSLFEDAAALPAATQQAPAPTATTAPK
jgi:preprotein translocase subunit SecG